jgi:hypothetical protein
VAARDAAGDEQDDRAAAVWAMVLLDDVGSIEEVEVIFMSSTLVKVSTKLHHYMRHNHALVTPSKRHLLSSNSHVNGKAKITLFNCHKASVGTSQAYI